MNPHLLSVNDLIISDIYQLFNQANVFKTLNTDSIEKVLNGKTVVLAFLSPLQGQEYPLKSLVRD